MKFIKEKIKSVRVRLFLSLCIVVAIIILFLIIINNVVLESFYLYSKVNSVKSAYEKINSYSTEIEDITKIEEELNYISGKNNFDILITNNKNSLVYASNRTLTTSVNKINEVISNNRDELIIKLYRRTIKVKITEI